MIYKYKDTEIFYEVYGQGDPIVIIHGWADPIVWNNSINILVNYGYKVIIPHLPGFGMSGLPPLNSNSFFYSESIFNLVKELEINNAIFIGHSFGGKLISLMTKHTDFIPKKCVLIDATGLNRFYFNVFIRNKTVHFFKEIFKILKIDFMPVRENKLFLKLFSSKDYQNAGKLQNVFKNIISLDTKEYYKNIKCPTLVIWGDEDTDTPLIDAVEITKLINNNSNTATLKILKNAGHFPFIDYPDLFWNEVNLFLQKPNDTK